MSTKYGYYILLYHQDPHSMFNVEECYGSYAIDNGFATEEEAKAAADKECDSAYLVTRMDGRATIFSYDADVKISEEDRISILADAETLCENDVLIQHKSLPCEEMREIIRTAKRNSI